jgi:hypothetical protein
MRKLVFLTFWALLLTVSFGSYTYAASDIAEQPCDTKFWNQLSSRAWLEAEREIMQNQNLIFKPDTVLAYTCFNKFVDVAAGPGGDIFVHTDYFQKKPIERGYDPGAMEIALKNVVAASAQQYFEGNFGHDYLGGRADKMSIPVKKYKEFDGQVRKDSPYGCNEMANIWQTAKCANFVDNSEFEKTDGFYPFKNMKGHGGGPNVQGYEELKEVRNWPTACKGVDKSAGPHHNEDPNNTATWENQIKFAKNENQALYQFQTPLNEIFKDVGEKLKPGECGKPGIPTGVMVYVKEQEKHMDGACTNPGCTYTAGGKDKAGTCQ